MASINSRNRLDELPFSYSLKGNDTVFIYWQGRLVTTLNGRRAISFLQRISGLDIRSRQLTMAKITGNFKRGNEKKKKRG